MSFFTEIYTVQLNGLKKECNAIEGMWNGDDKGNLEDKANVAHEIHQKCDEIINLLEELDK